MEMKRIIQTAITASALLIAASCTNSEIAPEVGDTGITDFTCRTFTAIIEQETTKTVLTDEYKVNWESGDLININGAVYSATPDASNAAKADFVFVRGTDPEPTYKAVFPADLYNAGSYALPATQTYSAGKFNAPMYAESENENLSFKNICGVICLALKGTESVRDITITANEPLCGSFAMTDATTVSLAGTGKTVTLNCDEAGVPLNEETATKFYIYLAPGTYSAGMKFVITNISGGVYEKTTAKDVTIERSNVYTFNWTSNFTPDPPVNALPGVFSVADGVQVHFACSNVYAKKTSYLGQEIWTWGLYNTQYGNSGGSRTATEGDSEIDLFTWGYHSTKSRLPIGEDSDNVDLVSGTLSQTQDWGNRIAGGSSSWRTPTSAEWQYLLAGRANASELYKCGVNVCGKHNCIVIAPDNWNVTANPLQAEYSGSSTPMTWAEAQDAGIVCLPAAGQRQATAVSDVGTGGYYWSSSATNSTAASYISFTGSGISFADDGSRARGYSVRLIAETGVAVESVDLNADLIETNPNGTIKLKATVLPADATNKNVTWSSSNTDVATVSQDGTVTGVSCGMAVITVMTTSGSKTATCAVIISSGSVTPEYVDMGLSVRWANCNLGASNLWDCGGYYQWAGTQDVSDLSIEVSLGNSPYHIGTDLSTWSKYVRSGDPDDKSVLDPNDDAAYVNLGEEWRIPTPEEWQELIRKCTWTWTDNYNGTGVPGNIVTGPSGKSIFLPAAGYRDGNHLVFDSIPGRYWSNSLSSESFFSLCLFYSDGGGGLFVNDTMRYFGLSIRPVCP